jgi:DNA-binding PadR family transcriptional regulator
MDGRMHGYRLNEYISQVMGLAAGNKRSTAYYALGRLEKHGHVTEEVEREGRRPERRVYEITEAGRARFYALLRSQLGGYSQTYYPDNSGVAFMDRLAPAEAARLLAQKRERVMEVRNRFRALPDHGQSLRHVVEHDVAHLEAELVWIEIVLSDLDANLT